MPHRPLPLALALAACTGEVAPPRAARQPLALAAPPVVTATVEAPATEGRPEARIEGPFGSLTIDRDGVVRLRDGTTERVLGRDAVAEVARSPDGAMAAWPRRTEGGTELVVCALPDGATRVVSRGALVADRPVFSPDGASVYFWGSDAAEPVAGLYRAPLDGASPPRRVLNVGLRGVGDPRFVTPPVDAVSQRFTGEGRLTYAGPEGAVTVDVGSP